MKLNYSLIEKNIAIYDEAKSILPIISQWENGEVGTQVMNQLGLTDFMIFHNFRKGLKLEGQELIIPKMNWSKLKPLLSLHTKSPRLAKFIETL